MPHFIFIQQISVLNILNMLYNFHFFPSSKCRLFHNAILFGFCFTHILNTGVLKFKKKKSVAKMLIGLLTELQQICCKRRPFQFMITRVSLSGFEPFQREWLLEIYTDNFLLNLHPCPLLLIKISAQNPRIIQDPVTKKRLSIAINL